MNVLFVCSRNQWRSPTAEAVWRRLPGVQVRSAGTSPKARRRVTRHDLLWADLVFVMETKHRRQLIEAFAEVARQACIEVLDIPDDFQFMDPDLVTVFEDLADARLG